MRRSANRRGVPAPYTATLAPISDPAGNPATITITSIMTNRPEANCGVCKTNEKTNEDCRCLPGEHSLLVCLASVFKRWELVFGYEGRQAVVA